MITTLFDKAQDGLNQLSLAAEENNKTLENIQAAKEFVELALADYEKVDTFNP